MGRVVKKRSNDMCPVDPLAVQFYKDRHSSDGLCHRCKVCRNAAGKKWISENPDAARAIDRARYKRDRAKRKVLGDKIRKQNPERHNERNRAWRAANPEKSNEVQYSWNRKNPDKCKAIAKRWSRKNPDKVAAFAAKRRAAKLRATPPWLTKAHLDQIAWFYATAKDLQWLSEEPLVVDHIMPLRGKRSCGLHVPWNLQIISAKQNGQKGNKEPEGISK